MEKQVDELGDLKVINCDRGIAWPRVMTKSCCFVSSLNSASHADEAVDAAAPEIGIYYICPYQRDIEEVRLSEVRPAEVRPLPRGGQPF